MYSSEISQLIEHQFINVAPAPPFSWLERFYDWVFGRVKVARGVFVLRRVATADVTAAHTQPQMHPRVANLQAIFASVGARGYFSNLIEMCALH